MKAEMARKLLIEKKMEQYGQLMGKVYEEGMADFRIQRSLAISGGKTSFIVYINPHNELPYDERYYRTRTIVQVLKEIKDMGYKVLAENGNGYNGGYYKISF